MELRRTRSFSLSSGEGGGIRIPGTRKTQQRMKVRAYTADGGDGDGAVREEEGDGSLWQKEEEGARIPAVVAVWVGLPLLSNDNLLQALLPAAASP